MPFHLCVWSWKEFRGPMSMPCTINEARRRLETNGPRYAGNYCLLFAISALLNQPVLGAAAVLMHALYRTRG
jgi:hypothetical protein